MIRQIVGFHQDEEGEWVAHLSCLHRQHVRHRPPFQDRAWVLDDEQRNARIGSPIDCSLCDRSELGGHPAAEDGRAVRTVVEPLDAGGGLVLRRPQPEDVTALADAITRSIEHLRPHMAWIAYEPLELGQRLELVEQWRKEWEGGGDMVLFMWLDDQLAGACGLHQRLGPHGLEIGYWVHVDHAGKGCATRASRALTDAAFTLPEIEFVEIHHDLNNVRSSRVPAKLGYEDLGVVPGEVHAPGDDGRDRIWRVTRAAWERRAPERRG